ncbi:Uncharacterized protein C03B1.10 [Melipona quadrifasciata]|uniref:Uncharacterized protein C03B1.10 n=1 Tax=Melipona quadrifasciata TaxID=166423 RepID=A0A0N0BIL5_9HYME|nr:Uncharacterized protein C03B1.10 [Melipona quadrifasciata]
MPDTTLLPLQLSNFEAVQNGLTSFTIGHTNRSTAVAVRRGVHGNAVSSPKRAPILSMEKKKQQQQQQQRASEGWDGKPTPLFKTLLDELPLKIKSDRTEWATEKIALPPGSVVISNYGSMDPAAHNSEKYNRHRVVLATECRYTFLNRVSQLRGQNEYSTHHEGNGNYTIGHNLMVLSTNGKKTHTDATTMINQALVKPNMKITISNSRWVLGRVAGPPAACPFRTDKPKDTIPATSMDMLSSMPVFPDLDPRGRRPCSFEPFLQDMNAFGTKPVFGYGAEPGSMHVQPSPSMTLRLRESHAIVSPFAAWMDYQQATVFGKQKSSRDKRGSKKCVIQESQIRSRQTPVFAFIFQKYLDLPKNAETPHKFLSFVRRAQVPNILRNGNFEINRVGELIKAHTAEREKITLTQKGVGWLAGWLDGWLAGWLAGWLDGWMAGWLAGPALGRGYQNEANCQRVGNRGKDGHRVMTVRGLEMMQTRRRSLSHYMQALNPQFSKKSKKGTGIAEMQVRFVTSRRLKHIDGYFVRRMDETKGVYVVYGQVVHSFECFSVILLEKQRKDQRYDCVKNC